MHRMLSYYFEYQKLLCKAIEFHLIYAIHRLIKAVTEFTFICFFSVTFE